MNNFPEIMIIRYYDHGVIDVSYSEDGSEKNKNFLENKLQKELENNKHLETYQIYFRGEGIVREEKIKNNV